MKGVIPSCADSEGPHSCNAGLLGAPPPPKTRLTPILAEACCLCVCEVPRRLRASGWHRHWRGTVLLDRL